MAPMSKKAGYCLNLSIASIDTREEEITGFGLYTDRKGSLWGRICDGKSILTYNITPFQSLNKNDVLLRRFQ